MRVRLEHEREIRVSQALVVCNKWRLSWHEDLLKGLVVFQMRRRDVEGSS